MNMILKLYDPEGSPSDNRLVDHATGQGDISEVNALEALSRTPLT